MLNISTCNLHVYHSAFQKGLHVFVEDISELVIRLYICLKLPASKWEDYEEAQRKLSLPTFCNTLNQYGLVWLHIHCELFESFMVLNNTSSLMSMQRSLPVFIIKHTKSSLIKSNVKIFWPKYTLLPQLLIYSTDFFCYFKRVNCKSTNTLNTLRVCVSGFDNNGKISKVTGICRVVCKRVTWYQNCTL